MAYRAYVGNFPFTFTKNDLGELFSSFGTVRAVDIILDRETGRSRGFGFVELETAEQLAAAIQGLHGTLVNGRPLTCNEARDRERSGGPSRGPGAGPGGGFAPRPSGDRGYGERPGYGDRGGDRPRSFDRTPGSERAPSFDRGPAPERGVPPSAGGAPTPRTGERGAPPPGGEPKRKGGAERNADRRHTKMDSYERDHKDWRRYSDDDDGWQ